MLCATCNLTSWMHLCAFHCSCVGGPAVNVERHGLYTSALVTSGEADGSTTQLQKTRVVLQTQNPIWRQKLGPVRVQSKVGALRLSVGDLESGTRT